MPNVFKIPTDIEAKYRGSGIALASVTGGVIVNLVYMRDLIEDFEEDRAQLHAALNDDRLGPTVRLLQSTGEVFVGMCSCWEFIEL